jgi:predicted lysophospholipase L1 biosynthesis ABC-type transport system permease subunit
VQSGYLLRETATKSVNTLVIFLLIMAVLTAVVGSIGLTGTMSINVLERTREIGVMRTIGAVDTFIMQSVIIEASYWPDHLVAGHWPVVSSARSPADHHRRGNDGLGHELTFTRSG